MTNPINKVTPITKDNNQTKTVYAVNLSTFCIRRVDILIGAPRTCVEAIQCMETGKGVIGSDKVSIYFPSQSLAIDLSISLINSAMTNLSNELHELDKLHEQYTYKRGRLSKVD